MSPSSWHSSRPERDPSAFRGRTFAGSTGHPLIAYAIAAARQSGVADRVVCSTDSEEIAEIARWYGADVPFLRPEEYSGSTSPDIEWLSDTLDRLPERYELFAIVRPTSPFRGPERFAARRDRLLEAPEASSIRAVELARQHPGKMWLSRGADDAAVPRPVRPRRAVARQPVPALPTVYVQTRALEIAWSRVVAEGSLGGHVRVPFLAEGHEGFSIDYEEDWRRAEDLVAAGVVLPRIDVDPWQP